VKNFNDDESWLGEGRHEVGRGKNWREKRVVEEMGEVRLPFIRAKVRGGDRSEEVNGGQ
jgi:hypothetical protein